MKHHSICVFGEVLFDIFPGGERVLGGAPFNVAWHLQAFAAAPLFISRVGDDPMGHEIHQTMLSWGMSTEGLQFDPIHPTGEVDITLTAGEPSYEILPDRAYDYIHGEAVPPVTPQLLYHGSLALRNRESLQALSVLQTTDECSVFLDVNLRPPWWQRKEVLEMLTHAHWVKLNEHELTQLAGEKGGIEERARQFRQEYALEGLVVTRGDKGAFAMDGGEQFAAITPSPAVEVIDTVGAGDAFTSVLILGLHHGWPLQQTLERAQKFASQLVGRRGATVDDPEFYRMFAEQWAL
ncbi:MAG: carbohydrate kinase [Sedimenticola sp.]